MARVQQRRLAGRRQTRRAGRLVRRLREFRRLCVLHKIITTTSAADRSQVLCQRYTLQKPVPETCTRKLASVSGAGFSRQLQNFWLFVQLMLNTLNKLNNFNNLKYKQNLQLQQTKTTTTLITDQSQISILITWSPDSVATLFYPTPESGTRKNMHQIV